MTAAQLPLQDLQSEVIQCQRLVEGRELEGDSAHAESVFKDILIRLDDVLQELAKTEKRITWTDDLPRGRNDVRDITDLISKLRNAGCHIGSGDRRISNTGIRFIFNRAFGKGNLLKVGAITIGSDYADDAAFFYGDLRIYLQRHIVKLLKHLQQILK